MNNRDYKNFALGETYHLYNRGNDKMTIFRDAQDYEFFLLRLKQNLYPSRFPPTKKNLNGYTPTYFPEDSFFLLCFCLMPNHYHLVLKQNSDIPLDRLMQKICTSYSKYFNKKYARVGSLFQDQFKAVRIDSDEQLRYLISYIHNNPVRAVIVTNNKDYTYSSGRRFTMVPIVNVD